MHLLEEIIIHNRVVSLAKNTKNKNTDSDPGGLFLLK